MTNTEKNGLNKIKIVAFHYLVLEINEKGSRKMKLEKKREREVRWKWEENKEKDKLKGKEHYIEIKGEISQWGREEIFYSWNVFFRFVYF